MSIWEAFGMGRYKGFPREAGPLLDEAVELAGGFGCKKADNNIIKHKQNIVYGKQVF